MKTLRQEERRILLEEELRTAEAPASAETISRIAAAYERAGLVQEALALLRKAGRFGIQSPEVLAPLLALLRQQRLYAELDRAVQSGLAVPQRSRPLRRELGAALMDLGRHGLAEAELAGLIQGGRLTEDDWACCARFVCKGVATPQFAQALEEAAARGSDSRSTAMWYCRLRSRVERDRPAARQALSQVAPDKIPTGEVLFDLAVLAWRLGDYGTAEDAARRACAFEATAGGAASLLSTIRSFAGAGSQLPEHRLPLARQVVERFLEVDPAWGCESTAWGVLCPDGECLIQAENLAGASDSNLVLPEGVPLAATCSILSTGPEADPYVPLASVPDWSWPHFMLRRGAGEQLLHTFIEAPESKEWSWREIRPLWGEATANPAALEPPLVSELWSGARTELHRVTLEELE